MRPKPPRRTGNRERQRHGGPLPPASSESTLRPLRHVGPRPPRSRTAQAADDDCDPLVLAARPRRSSSNNRGVKGMVAMARAGGPGLGKPIGPEVVGDVLRDGDEKVLNLGVSEFVVGVHPGPRRSPGGVAVAHLASDGVAVRLEPNLDAGKTARQVVGESQGDLAQGIPSTHGSIMLPAVPIGRSRAAHWSWRRSAAGRTGCATSAHRR